MIWMKKKKHSQSQWAVSEHESKLKKLNATNYLSFTNFKSWLTTWNFKSFFKYVNEPKKETLTYLLMGWRFDYLNSMVCWMDFAFSVELWVELRHCLLCDLCSYCRSLPTAFVTLTPLASCNHNSPKTCKPVFKNKKKLQIFQLILRMSTPSSILPSRFVHLHPCNKFCCFLHEIQVGNNIAVSLLRLTAQLCLQEYKSNQNRMKFRKFPHPFSSYILRATKARVALYHLSSQNRIKDFLSAQTSAFEISFHAWNTKNLERKKSKVYTKFLWNTFLEYPDFYVHLLCQLV